MVRNTLVDMHNILFEQLERLNDAETPEEVEQEMQRSKSMADIAKVMVENSRTVLDAHKTALEYNYEKAGDTPNIFIEHKEDK